MKLFLVATNFLSMSLMTASSRSAAGKDHRHVTLFVTAITLVSLALILKVEIDSIRTLNYTCHKGAKRLYTCILASILLVFLLAARHYSTD